MKTEVEYCFESWVSAHKTEQFNNRFRVNSEKMLLRQVITALRRVDPPSKESYRLCIGSRNWKSGQGLAKGCRAIIIIIIYGDKRWCTRRVGQSHSLPHRYYEPCCKNVGRRMNWKAWCSLNALHDCFGCHRFKSRQEHRESWLEFSAFSFPPEKYRYRPPPLPITLPFHT
jgi:hypothetical protein